MVEILVEDLDFYFQKESDAILLEQILKNTKRYIKIFQDAIDKCMPPARKVIRDEEFEETEEILMNQRLQNLVNADENKNKQNNARTQIPPELKRK